MGTSLDLRILARSAGQAQLAEDVVLAAIARESAILSGYDPQSEFRRWFETSGVPVRVSPELLEVLGLYDRWRLLTGGALDAAAAAASRTWEEAARAGRVPTRSELDAAVVAMRRTHWSLDPAAATATHLSDVPLALNSFTKSYIIDRAASAALASGHASGVVVNAGGDLVVRGDWVETVRTPAAGHVSGGLQWRGSFWRCRPMSDRTDVAARLVPRLARRQLQTRRRRRLGGRRECDMPLLARPPADAIPWEPIESAESDRHPIKRSVH